MKGAVAVVVVLLLGSVTGETFFGKKARADCRFCEFFSVLSVCFFSCVFT